jgi:hypothetical protein
MPLAAPSTVLLEFGSAVVNVVWPMTARAAWPFTKSAAYRAAEQKMITGIHFMGNRGRVSLALVNPDYSKR